VANTFATTFDVRCQRNGLFSALSTCRNIDDCEGHSCGSNGRCIDGINDYSCNCEDGFEEVVSESGEKMCGNIDDCGPGACGGDGACHDLVNGYECECDLGYVLQGSGEDQLCVPEICPLPAWDNVIAPDVTELFFPYTLVMECMDGYDLGGGGSKARTFFAVQCEAGGMLTSGGNPAIPECVPKVCGTPPNVGAEVVELRDYHFGETSISVCQGGEVTVTHECGADGQFLATSEFRTCRNQCDGLRVPEHASLTGGSVPITHPDAATFTCHTGFTPLETGEPGQPFSQACRATGLFESLTVGADGCFPVVCAKPSLPANWEWVNEAADFNFVTGARMRCRDGFQSDLCGADGTYRLACGDDGHAANLPSPCEENTYRVEGRVRNAVNPTQTIPHATIVIGGQTTTTDATGYYAVNLQAGSHHYSVTAQNYISVESASVSITTHATFDIIISPVLASDSWRVVLEWTDQPLDLDSHLVFKGHEWSCDELYYGYPRASCNGVSAHLDWDETQGFGPETVTIEGVNNCQDGWFTTCKWVYKVKNFSGWWHMSQEGWVRSNAKVRLFNGDHLIREFNVNNGEGHQASDGGFDFSHQETDYYWSVFSIDGDGNVQACSDANC
jgi:Notch-like protein